jgi:alkylation response protein AidB-like acyl-CoA dehydrogenase
MKQPLDDRQSGIVKLAGTLAEEFAETATEHDRTGLFPFANYDRMRETGYLGLTVPEELGGRGASLSDLILAQERLAAGCGSTALAVNMHLSPMGQIAEAWRRTFDPTLERLLRGAALGEVIYAAMPAERGHSLLMTSNSIAQRVDGGYLVTGEKIFGTESAICTHFTSMARFDDPEGGSRVLLFRLPRAVDGIGVRQMWDTMGMRATQSNDFTLSNVFVPEDAVFHSFPVDHFDATLLRTIWSWSSATFGAVYLGIADGAMAYARKQIRKRGHEDNSQIQHLFAEMEVLQETARAVLYRHGEEFDSGVLIERLTVQEGMSRAVLAKYVATNNAQRIVDLAMHAVGGAGYAKASPLERMYRDVRAGTIMPYNNLDALNLFGKTSLGIQIAPSVALREAGHNREPLLATSRTGHNANERGIAS